MIHMVPSITTFNNRYLTKLCNKYLDEAYALMDLPRGPNRAALQHRDRGRVGARHTMECNFIDYTQDRSVRL